MITISETDNLKQQCFCNPLFEILFQRIRILLKYQSLIKDNAGEWSLLKESDFIPVKPREINDQSFIDPLTKKIYEQAVVTTNPSTFVSTLEDGTVVYPAYSFILATKVKDIIPGWAELRAQVTDPAALAVIDLIGELYLYQLVGAQVEAITTANNWHLINQ